MTTRTKRLTTSTLPNPTDIEARYVLHVYDEHDKRIMWCGPLTEEGRDDLVRLFRSNGWTTLSRETMQWPSQ